MQVFSDALIELYEAAERLAISEYPLAVMQAVARLIGMDGGMLGSGNGDRLAFEQAYVFRRAAWIASDLAAVLLHDPLARCLLRGIQMPVVCDCEQFYSGHTLFLQDLFYRRHHIARMLLLGGVHGDGWDAPWIALFRSTGASFGEGERQTLLSLWPHIVRGITNNRLRCLERQVADSEGRAAALMSREGMIEAEDRSFRLALLDEWPNFSGRRMPDAIVQSWRSGTAFVGEHIRILMRAQREYVLCHAKQCRMPGRLTRAERVVACQFASGLSHRQIAENLGVSQNTVRSHITRTYEKLDVHDKAALANVLTGAMPVP